MPGAAAAGPIRYADLGLDPVLLDLGLFQLRWYSLAYLAGIILGYYVLTRMLKRPGAPMAQRHLDDLLFYGTLGVIVGGRIGYVLFYEPGMLADPLAVLRVWQGGMSFHGGALGTMAAIGWLCWRGQLNYWRVADYVACIAPFGLLFGRLANFVNGELWGRPTDVPWAIVFPTGNDPVTNAEIARHPSQLYEAGLEGLLLLLLLSWFFWRTDARYKPGYLAGVFALGYGLSRFLVEFVRSPDEQLAWLVDRTGLSMGQWLTVPIILLGLWLIATAARRRVRVEPFAGNQSVA